MNSLAVSVKLDEYRVINCIAVERGKNKYLANLTA